MAPLPAAGSVTSISAVAFDDVWAVGSYTTQGGYAHAFAEHFDGVAWQAVRVPGLALTAVRMFGKNDAWAVGYRSDQGFLQTLAVHWDGSAWRTVPTPDANNSVDTLEALAGTSTDDLWATGSYFDPSSHATLTIAEHWNGSAWSLVPTPNVDIQSDLTGAYAAAPDDVWAVGFHDNVGGTHGAPLIEHWNGRRWSVVADPLTPFPAYADLSAISGISSDDIWAVGLGFLTDDGPSATLTAHWDGVRWNYVPSPNVGTSRNLLDGVAMDDAGKVVAVGSASFGESAIVERWNGRKWYVDRTALSPRYSQLDSVSIDGRDEVWAAGYSGRLPYDEFDCR